MTVVDVSVLDIVLIGVVEVVVSSLHPHHPGVSQVDVRVAVVVVLKETEVVAVGSDPLLSKYFQLKQSTHSVSSMHSGNSSYARMTSEMTDLILCQLMLTRQFLSLTVS